ncbi:MAG TPA: phosphate ABC transporter ATP-binding protein PstB [Gemmatimonadaceae bacterium]|nr:phosphate ABC transporter ATP-binding protein PstB [Gemmatimonadaceae bacterium]
MTDDVRMSAPALTSAAHPAVSGRVRVDARNVNAFFGAVHAIRDVSLAFRDHTVTAIIGPSGCGKSTFLRCLNRMHETVPGARVTGTVMLDGTDIYAKGSSPIRVRRHIGMVFQRPTPFPTMSVRDNVAAGLRTLGDARPSRSETNAIVERALRRAALWDEVADRLSASALALSGGQQQRLCIARALATEPGILLLDEPTASLDPLSAQRVEELIYELRKDMTVVIVTHNMQQAARVSETTAFFLNGELIEAAPTRMMFTTPSDSRTEAYITGRFG